MDKLSKENLRVAKCKMPKEELARHEGLVAERWGCHEDFFLFDNSKMMMRQKTRWRPPTLMQYKLNFDEATNGGIGATGGVLWDKNGDVMLVYARKVRDGRNNLAKAMALLWGLQLTREIQIKELTIEGDFKLIIDLVKGVARLGWNIRNTIMDIKQVLNRMENVHLQHIYKEGNKVVDGAATMGFNALAITCWRNWVDLNKDIKSLIILERGGNNL